MRTAVIGGTGSLGRLVVDQLVRRGDEVRVLSRTPPALPVAGAEHHPVDLRTGSGLDAALDGVEVVVDAANGQQDPGELLVGGTGRTLEAGAAAGVAHHVLISIVGCDVVPLAYYRAKAEQERLVAAASVPSTVLRATQFHPLLAGLFERAARLGVRPRAAVPLQLLDPAVAAVHLADAAHAGPAGRLPDLAGPRRQSVAELADTWSRATGRGRIPVRVPLPGQTGRAVRSGALCAATVGDEGPDFRAWLARGRSTAQGPGVGAPGPGVEAPGPGVDGGGRT
ncbi:SDR family oxidoreductase [Patulibacter sp.]|uniref:SDR family oxidoreductase n=1 Tax=Patulibacter sp. TaxID=1912859 RepID=UPI002724BE86|nr:SDR family oxidoreductase [Patulibacter sp.]MDO9407156.1 SDR family oxidoreductase [Patulibacter sp.]